MPKLRSLKQYTIYYLTTSVGQESGYGLAVCIFLLKVSHEVDGRRSAFKFTHMAVDRFSLLPWGLLREAACNMAAVFPQDKQLKRVQERTRKTEAIVFL